MPRFLVTPQLIALILSVGALATPLQAQRRTDDDWLANCRESDRYDRSDRAKFCEVREERLRASRGPIRVDARENGGISIRGWDEDEIVVHARVQTQARSMDDARDIARDIRVDFGGSTIRATGPRTDRGESWSVSYEIFVPRRADLDLQTMNGPISVERVSGRMEMNAVNGPLTLRGVGGDVRGRTENGPLTVQLDGDRWSGTGLDAQTTNGPVTIDIPDRYSARLETGTVNGPITLGFPIMMQGRIGRRIETTLGDGGATVRAITTNGPLMVRKRGYSDSRDSRDNR
jgi:hypothetical protein